MSFLFDLAFENSIESEIEIRERAEKRENFVAEAAIRWVGEEGFSGFLLKKLYELGFYRAFIWAFYLNVITMRIYKIIILLLVIFLSLIIKSYKIII